MHRAVWERLNVPITANKATNLVSANSTAELTMGMVEHLPVTLGPVTFYLQVQVVDNAPFDLLLGRPFFDVASCSETSRPGGHHVIQIRDPATKTPYVFTTKPKKSAAAENFRN
jgi:hypothetical protein